MPAPFGKAHIDGDTDDGDYIYIIYRPQVRIKW